MFWLKGRAGDVEFAFTDAELDLSTSVQPVIDALRLPGLAQMHQVHGATVADAAVDALPHADALVVEQRGPAGLVRVADCTPIVLMASDTALAAVVHAGRVGMVAGVVGAAVAALRARGAAELTAVLGPRACGLCYEVPQVMADEVEAAAPGSRSMTSWGTPSIDLGAGVTAQLVELGVAVDDAGLHACTIEDERFFSYRRQGAAAGRFGAVAVVR